jgi:hypothetical protein
VLQSEVNKPSALSTRFAGFLPGFLPQLELVLRSSFSCFFCALLESLISVFGRESVGSTLAQRGTNSGASGFSFEPFVMLGAANILSIQFANNSQHINLVHLLHIRSLSTSTLWNCDGGPIIPSIYPCLFGDLAIGSLSAMKRKI